MTAFVPDAPRDAIAEPGSDRSALDRAIYEDFSRVNNELVNLQRDLVRTNLELQASEERHRLLNRQLDDRVRSRTAELERALADLKVANRAKSAFLAMMSHELRTPMNGILGMIGVLRETPLSDVQGSTVDFIHQSAQAQLAILGNLIDVADAQAGRIELLSIPIRLASAVEEGCAGLRQAAAKRNLSISLRLDPRVPATLLGDPGRLRQVVFSLVENAIKFSGGAPVPAEVAVRTVFVGRDGDAVSLDLVVADTGIGMSEATIERLFAPFSQADASITRRHGGAGIGLAMSDLLVRLMGGTLSVTSVLGQGSTLTARLRLALAPGSGTAIGTGMPASNSSGAFLPAACVPSRDEARRLGRLILVVEDDDMNRRVIARQMKLIGMAFDMAADGLEAIEKWRSGDFVLVLTDLHMPRMDGYALTAAIRAEEGAARRTPVIALTADSRRDEAQRCLALGMDAYLTKPVDLQNLRAAIETRLAGAVSV